MERGWLWRLGMLALAAVALYGLLTVVNAGAFLVGIGPERVVHVERIRIDAASTTDAEGSPTIIDVRVGVGFYVDDDGRRHATELVGFAGRPGDVVHTRQPLLPDWLAFPSHRPAQAVGALLLGMSGIVPAAVMYHFRDD
jgi:hypothetical protein